VGRGKAAKTIALVRACQEILREIQPASVRAVCYQLFVRKLLASMAKNETNKVSTQLTWAREQGYLPWDWIVDESRATEYAGTDASPEAFFASLQDCYRKDRWAFQPRRVEVWSEKGTVRGTLAPVLHEYGIDFRVLHGYGSATVVHQAAAQSRQLAQPLLVFYVGDWDPSGLHMSEEDLPSRLERYGGYIELRRVALDHLDIRDPDLPGFAAADKVKDPRHGWFVANHGHRCWELDALNPAVLRARVEDAILEVIDWPTWEQAARVDEEERQSVNAFLASWKERTA
jgi:hypothetical protein